MSNYINIRLRKDPRLTALAKSKERSHSYVVQEMVDMSLNALVQLASRKGKAKP